MAYFWEFLKFDFGNCQRPSIGGFIRTVARCVSKCPQVLKIFIRGVSSAQIAHNSEYHDVADLAGYKNISIIELMNFFPSTQCVF